MFPSFSNAALFNWFLFFKSFFNGFPFVKGFLFPFVKDFCCAKIVFPLDKELFAFALALLLPFGKACEPKCKAICTPSCYEKQIGNHFTEV